MKKFILSPSILSANFANLKFELDSLEENGSDWIHIDVMDGHFVPNITMGPFIVEHCHQMSDLPLDVHLMIENPERHIEAFSKAGASWMTVHIENNPNVYRTLQNIRELGVHPAIAINPGTPSNQIESVIGIVDMVLIMTVNPGFSGQKHISSMRSKVKEVKTLAEAFNPSLFIEVDGGITVDTLPPMIEAGANVIVAATSIFRNPKGIAAGIQQLRDCVKI